MKSNKFILLSVACSFLALTGCMREQAAEVVHVRRAKPYHVVKNGETLESVAAKYKMRPDTLSRLNRLKAPYSLITGQRLIVHAQDEDGEQSSELVAPTTPQVQSNSISENEVSVKPLIDEGSSTGGLGNVVAPIGGAALGAGAAAANANSDIKQPSGGAENQAEAADSNAQQEASATTYDWPVQGKVTQAFNEPLKNGTKSDGIIISAPMNTKVKAVADGVLRSAGNKLAAYGKMVVIKHSDGKMTIYAHLNDMFVKQPAKGEIIKIKKGEIIGTVGKTGIATQPQLYFQVRMPAPDLTPINPADVLP